MITWKREGKEITKEDRMTLSNKEGVSSLEIMNVQCSDSGRYSVRIENRHGAEECKAQLIVVGKLR